MKKETKIGIAVSVAVIALIGFIEVDASSTPDPQEEVAWNMIQADDYSGKNIVKQIGRDNAIKDARAFCAELPKHTYRSDADQATTMASDDLSYRLAITSGVEVLCPDAWNNAKRMD